MNDSSKSATFRKAMMKKCALCGADANAQRNPLPLDGFVQFCAECDAKLSAKLAILSAKELQEQADGLLNAVKEAQSTARFVGRATFAEISVAYAENLHQCAQDTLNAVEKAYKNIKETRPK